MANPEKRRKLSGPSVGLSNKRILEKQRHELLVIAILIFAGGECLLALRLPLNLSLRLLAQRHFVLWDRR
jgi:hypothetical protein